MAYLNKGALGVLLAVVFLAGCSTRIGDFTTVSTKNVDMDAEYQKVGNTKGADGAFLGQPDMKLAVDAALENAGSNARYLTNARIFTVNYPLYTKIRVKGDAWAPASTANASGPVYELEKTTEGTFLVSEDGSERIEIFKSSEHTLESEPRVKQAR